MAEALDMKFQEFSRYEFKYLLDANRRKNIEREVQMFMSYDGHAMGDDAKSYFVRSLYFDNSAMKNFYEKIDGVRSRSKYRLRTYSKNAGDAPTFLEKKSRKINRVLKERTLISSDDAHLFKPPINLDRLLRKYQKNRLVNEFVGSMLREILNPVLVVDYFRSPYTSQYDANFRVTFDDCLSAYPSDTLFADGTGLKKVIAGYTILEVKFNRKIPSWFHRIIQAYNLERLSISKYVAAAKETGMAIDLS